MILQTKEFPGLWIFSGKHEIRLQKPANWIQPAALYLWTNETN